MSGSLPKVNTHIHLPPNFSAFTTVDEALEQAHEEGIEILGASNYYDFTVYGPFAEKARAKGIEPLFGIEIVCRIADLAKSGVKINDPGNPGKMYICGKALTAFDQPTTRAEAIFGKIRSGDEQRIAQMVELLRTNFAAGGLETGLDAGAIIARVAQRFGVPASTVVLQERHVAQAFQEALFAMTPISDRAAKMESLFGAPAKAGAEDAVGVQGEIRTHLMKAGKPAFVEELFVTYEEAKELIEELGGIVSYPVLADGMNPISDFESDPDELAAKLLDLGITSAEFIPNRNHPEVLTRYVEALGCRDFSLSAGTEHNTTEKIAVMPECKGGVPIPNGVQSLFVQGAKAQVEHQARTK